jgi:hypothetical protein
MPKASRLLRSMLLCCYDFYRYFLQSLGDETKTTILIGATTFSLMTLCVMAFSIQTLTIMTLSITTLSILTFLA